MFKLHQYSVSEFLFLIFANLNYTFPLFNFHSVEDGEHGFWYYLLEDRAGGFSLHSPRCQEVGSILGAGDVETRGGWDRVGSEGQPVLKVVT